MPPPSDLHEDSLDTAIVRAAANESQRGWAIDQRRTQQKGRPQAAQVRETLLSYLFEAVETV
jgi:hypothetical protein